MPGFISFTGTRYGTKGPLTVYTGTWYRYQVPGTGTCAVLDGVRDTGSAMLFSGLLRRVAAAPTRVYGVLARSPMPPAAPHAWAACMPRASGLLGLSLARSIITVDVHQPVDRMTTGTDAALRADVARAEDIALSTYNRLVNEEVARGTIRNGRRGGKRFARTMRPTFARRDHCEKRIPHAAYPHALC